MDVERRILRSASILFFAGALSQLTNFAFVTIVARQYGPVVFGEYSFALSLGAMLSIGVSLGANRWLMRECSARPDCWAEHAGVLLPAQCAIAVLLIGGVAATSAWLNIPRDVLYVLVATVSLQLLTPVTGLLVIGFSGSERMSYAAFSDLGLRLLILIVAGWLALRGAAPGLVLAVLPVSALAVGTILYRLADAEFGRPKFRLEAAALRSIWQQSLPFLGIAAVTTLYMRVGLLILRGFGGAGEVGIFAPAERLIMAAGILYLTFSRAVFPPLVRLYGEDRARFSQLANRSTRVFLMLAMPAATALFVFAEDVVLLLFGDSYLESAQVLRIVAPLLVLRALSLLLDRLAVASDETRLALTAKSLSLAGLIAFALLLVPGHGASGLAVALIIAQCLQLVMLARGLRVRQLMPALIRPLVATGTACLLTVLLLDLAGIASTALRLAIGLLAGLCLLWAFRAVQVADVRYLRKLLG